MVNSYASIKALARDTKLDEEWRRFDNRYMNKSLEINGDVASPKTFSFDELKKLPGQVADVSKLIPGREGSAVKLSVLLDNVKASKDAGYLTLSTEDGNFSASIPRGPVADRGLVVYQLNGAPLPEDKGGPIRFFIVDVDSCGVADLDKCANVKYLSRIELSKTPGRDYRPKTKKTHEELHESEKKR